MITYSDIESWVASLAQSKGFYGRLLRDLQETDDETRQSFVNAVNQAGVKDSVDFVMFIEQ